jgi:ribonuclease VapC
VIADTSAIVAIVLDEPEAEACLKALLDASNRRMSAATLLEAAIVVDQHPNPRAATTFDQLIEENGITVEPVTGTQVAIAREAYRRYGKGSGHPTKLNFGDCFAYALAIHYDEPLLFIGNDFVHTDVRRVLG